VADLCREFGMTPDDFVAWAEAGYLVLD
jgi:hypothetical protein